MASNLYGLLLNLDVIILCISPPLGFWAIKYMQVLKRNLGKLFLFIFPFSLSKIPNKKGGFSLFFSTFSPLGNKILSFE